MASDGWRDDDDMAFTLHILFIEGCCNVLWMETSFVRCPPVVGGVQPFSCHTIFHVWCTNPSYLDDNNIPPDAFGMKRCQDEIRSGKHHAIVMVDYSNNQSGDFDNAFGDLLQNFVREGGVVALPSLEGFPVVSTLRNYFDVEWKSSDY